MNLISRNTFGRSVLILMTGTTLAQAIPVAISPILSRLYAPKDFGILTLYIAFSSILSGIATLRYELAIVQPRHDEDAAALLALSVIVTISISTIIFLVILIFNKQIKIILGDNEIGKWLYLLPISVLLTGIYQSLNYWKIRTKEYKEIAYNKFSQGLGTSGIQVILGKISIYSGLIWGQIIGQAVSLWFFISRTYKNDKMIFKQISREKIFENAKNYKKFPQYSAFGAFADTASLQMPVLILGKFHDTSTTGLFGLTFKVLNLPASLISQALSQVLFQKIANLHYDAPEKIRLMIVKLFLILISMMIPFVIFMWMFGEPLFAFVFGEPWREAGSIAGILALAAAIRFSVSPLSIVLGLEHNIKIGVLWQFIHLFTITAVLYIFRLEDSLTFLTVFVIEEIILYLLYLALILQGTKYAKKG